ncbi:MAG: Ig-like domain-containing protein [Oscillospiraceae bacterium]|nr:Ig-like domain-containing protein [Oscillospiraceae bacterium]
MAYLLNNKKVLGIVIGILLAVITLTVTVVAVVANTPEKDPGGDVSHSAVDEPVEEPDNDPVEEPDPETPDTTPIVFNNPDEMRGVWLVPGTDFLTGGNYDAATVKAAIDSAIADAKNLMMNTIIIDSVYGDYVLYQSGTAASVPTNFDVMEYIVAKCRANGLYVYSTFDVLKVQEDGKNKTAEKVDAAVLTAVTENAKSFAQKYDLDGVLLDHYYLSSAGNGTAYAAYLSTGGGMGFENYMYSATSSAMKAAVDAFHQGKRNIQVGLLSDAVWANKSTNEAGSDTSASFQALVDGYADTKSFVEQGYYDFVAVKSFASRNNTVAPFTTVIKWWATLAQQKGIPLYAVQASSKSVSTESGWTSPTELTEQVIEARKVTGYKGSMFDSLSRLKADPQGSTTALKKLFSEELDVEYFATKLEVAKPKETTFTTYEPTVVFSGSSDPYFDALFNGEKLERDANGYFSMELELKPGLNTFTFKHKDQSVTYNITRVVKVLESISPQGNLTVNGGTEVTVSAMAYKDAKVTASLGGQSIQLTRDTADDDSTDKDTNFVKFSGKFTIPAAGSSAQSLGNVSISASWSGATDSLQGAYVTVNKKVQISDGVLIQVTASQAETFPDNTLDDLSQPSYFPICKGSLDFVVGDELVYKEGSTTYSYYNLASGRRVYSKDITTVGGSMEKNVISGLQVVSDSSHTYVKLKMSQKAAYTFNYSSSALNIEFHYTDSVPDDLSLSKNPLFSSASWSGSTLKLKLKNGFLGYKAYYESDTGYLVFQCNNPPASMSAARIVIDPGHCNTDPGALGFREDYNEYEVNLAISKYLKAELESMGAYVYMNNTTNGKVELLTRMNNGKSADPHLLVSVHANSSTSSSASGSEAYYFNAFSTDLASKASSAASGALETGNRGAKFGRFYMTRDSEFPAILLETGFVSNQSEYYKLITASYQKSIASQVASAIKSYLSAAGMGNTATGTQAVGDMSGGSAVAVTGVSLDQTAATIKVGETLTLAATVKPENATNKEITWTSSNEAVAVVSANGTVTGKKEGTATITATTASGGKTATCKITVKGTTASVTLNRTEIRLQKGDKYQLTAASTGGSGTVTYTWSTGNSSVATVDSSGMVTANAVGITTITVTASTGATTVCEVTVSSTSSSSGSSSSSSSSSSSASSSSSSGLDGIVPDDDEISIRMGKSQQLTYEVRPSTANPKVTFKSGDTQVATVTESGSVVGVGVGVTTVTLTAEDGSTCEWTVTVTSSGSVWH